MTLLVQTMAMNITRFWGWWLYELGLLAPSWLRDFFYTPRTYLFIRIKNFQVFFSYVDKDSEKELLHVYMHKEGQLQQDAFFKTHPEWMHATKILLLNPKQLLKKRLDLPLAAQNNLIQVLGYELDRYTPFNNDQCYFSTQILDKNKASNRLVLELIFISKQKLHNYYNELQNLGLKIDIISHEDYSGPRNQDNSLSYTLSWKRVNNEREQTEDFYKCRKGESCLGSGQRI
ncbi:MAG: hypothetical protein NTV00_17195, partial [Methylococcales bacterium]|nr:hypothetical protein [Methylococcales bacterium]